jgi:DNA polymerase-1
VPILETQDLNPDSLDAFTRRQAYNGMDASITLEVLLALKREHPEEPLIYGFERALQGPYLEIMQRGFKIDQESRSSAAEELRSRIEHLQVCLNRLASEVWDFRDTRGNALNPKSFKQLKEFFYDTLNIPPVMISQKGVRRVSCNREALEKIEQYLYARPVISCILSIRDLSKQLEVFETEIDLDGRYRTSYNIAGTETGRASSSENAFGTGGNAQNIAERLRYVFISDPGWKLCVIDLEQVEARDVGFFLGCLFGDWRYLDAAEAGDLHTTNCRLTWPELPWTGDLKKDREIADRIFYRDWSYRTMMKRGGHGTNYYASPWTMSRHLKIPISVAEEFQLKYCKGGEQSAYPCIPDFWSWIKLQLQTTHKLVTPFGRQRHFFGRDDDDATLREAIAFLPQSTTADRTNLGLWRVWHKMPEVQMLAQTHDSITFQYRPEDEERVVQQALELMEVGLKAPNGRSYVVPGEAKVGWNWGNEVTQKDIDKALAAGKSPPRLNPLGLRKWKPGMHDERCRP